jgi:predicted dehydrogenase
MTAHAPIGTLVVGADPSGRGFGARAHLPAVLGLPDLRLAAVCTSRPETARAAAERWGAARWYADYREAVADDDVELVTVSVRVRLHRQVVLAALEAGKAVYCEWPLGLSSEDAEPMARLARERSLPCMVGTQGRFSPAARLAREILRRGDIGAPLSYQASQLLPKFDVHSSRWWYAHEDEASGALYVATAHVLDTVQALLGPVEGVCGARDTLSPRGRYADTGEEFRWEASDTVALVARHGAVLGSALVANTATPSAGFTLRILGEEGQLLLTAPDYISFGAPTLRVACGGGAFEEQTPPLDLRRGTTLDDGDPGLNVALALAALADVVREGGSVEPSFDEALRMHRLVEAVARSSDGGGWETVG